MQATKFEPAFQNFKTTTIEIMSTLINELRKRGRRVLKKTGLGKEPAVTDNKAPKSSSLQVPGIPLFPSSQSVSYLSAGEASSRPSIDSTRSAPPAIQSGHGTEKDHHTQTTLWSEAAAELSSKARAALGIGKAGMSTSIDDLLTEVEKKRDECGKNGWEFEFRGRKIVLREQADNVITCLNKFKEIGDVIVQYDPAHAALPWAGVRFLLQVIYHGL